MIIVMAVRHQNRRLDYTIIIYIRYSGLNAELRTRRRIYRVGRRRFSIEPFCAVT